MPVLETLNRRMGRRARRDAVVQGGGLAGLLFMLAAIPAIDVYRTWAGARAEKRAWTISGPPCPVVAQVQPSVVGHRAPRTFTFNDIAFTRHLGDVSCAAFREAGVLSGESYSVCQFSGASAVTVETVAGRTTFQAGPGRQTTVTVRRGEASCVINGWFSRRPRNS